MIMPMSARKGVYLRCQPIIMTMAYNKYKSYGYKQIEADESITDVDFKDDDEWALFRRVFDVFSVYSATGLSNFARGACCGVAWGNIPQNPGGTDLQLEPYRGKQAIEGADTVYL